MSVVFTPNLGLAKPTDTELAENWVNTQHLCSDNNFIIETETDIEMLSTTPTFVGPTTNPSVGAGQIQLEYNKSCGIIMGEFVLVFTDPGVSSGTGTGGYGIRLPELLDTTFHTVCTGFADNTGIASVVGEGHWSDASLSGSSMTLLYDVVHFGGVAYLRPLTEEYTGKTVRWFGPSLPVALADGDKITGNFIYKAA